MDAVAEAWEKSVDGCDEKWMGRWRHTRVNYRDLVSWKLKVSNYVDDDVGAQKWWWDGREEAKEKDVSGGETK